MLPDEIPLTTSPEPMSPYPTTDEASDREGAGARSHEHTEPPPAPADPKAPSPYVSPAGVGETSPESRPAGQKGQPYNRYTPSDIDYDKKYAPDAYGEEVGPSARVWSVYNDEAQMFDAEMVQGLNGTLDVLLVFAGLFSGVVTTFVAQSSQALDPDYAQITASLMYELTRMQRAIATGIPIGDVPHSEYSLDSETHTVTDLWVNGLWLTSLVFSLSTAFMSVLAKQWLQHFIAITGGTARDRAYVRQYRLWSFERWNVPFIIGFLPVLLNIALLLFLGGLAVYVTPMNATISYAIISFSAVIFLAYTITIVLPIVVPHCAYKTPISDYVLYVCELLVRVARFHLDLFRNAFRLRHIIYKSHGRLAVRLFVDMWKDYVRTPMHSRGRLDLKSREMVDVNKRRDFLTAEAISWLCFSSSNTSAASIAVQAVSGLPMHFLLSDAPATWALAIDVFSILQRACDSAFDPWANAEIVVDYADTIERLGRAMLHFDDYSDITLFKLWDEVYAYRDLIMSPHVDALLRVMLLNRNGTGTWSPLRAKYATYAANMTTFPTWTVELHPIVWRELYSAFAKTPRALLTQEPEILPSQTYALLTCMWTMLTQECQEELPGPPTHQLFDRSAIFLNHYCAWSPAREELVQVMAFLIGIHTSQDVGEQPNAPLFAPFALNEPVDVTLMRLFPIFLDFIGSHEPLNESQEIWATVGLDQMSSLLARRFARNWLQPRDAEDNLMLGPQATAAVFAATESVLTNLTFVSQWARANIVKVLGVLDAPSLYEIFCRNAGLELLLCAPVGHYSLISSEVVDAVASFALGIERIARRRPLTAAMKVQTALLLDFDVLLNICEYAGLHGRNGLRALCRMTRGAHVWRAVVHALARDRHRNPRRIMSCAIARALLQEMADGEAARDAPDFSYVYLSGPELEMHDMKQVSEKCANDALRSTICIDGELRYGPCAVPWEFIESMPMFDTDDHVVAANEQMHALQPLPGYEDATSDVVVITPPEDPVPPDARHRGMFATLRQALGSGRALPRRETADPGV
ncbi:hypothetical protein HDZ31DRAFT_37990 [Schizophyllum fasciatum]